MCGGRACRRTVRWEFGVGPGGGVKAWWSRVSKDCEDGVGVGLGVDAVGLLGGWGVVTGCEEGVGVGCGGGGIAWWCRVVCK